MKFIKAQPGSAIRGKPKGSSDECYNVLTNPDSDRDKNYDIV